MQIGEKIKTLRKAKKLTQEQLAEALHVSPQAVSKWETGTSSPDVEMLPRLAAYFGTSMDELFDYDRRKLEAEVDALLADPNLSAVLALMEKSLGCGADEARELFLTVFCAAHGLASLLANNTLEYDEAQAVRILEAVFDGMKG